MLPSPGLALPGAGSTRLAHQPLVPYLPQTLIALPPLCSNATGLVQS